MYSHFINQRKLISMSKTGFIIFMVLFLFSCNSDLSEFQSENFIKFYGNGQGSIAYDAEELSEGGFLVVGYENTLEFNKQILLIRTDEYGNTVWKKLFGDEDQEEATKIQPFEDGYLIAGSSVNDFTTERKGFLLKVSTNGDSLWYKDYKGKSKFQINDVLINQTSIYIVGSSDTLDSSNSDYFIAELDFNGDQIWDRVIPGIGEEQFTNVFLNSEGNIITVGSTNSVVSSENVFYVSIAKLSSVGIPVHSKNISAVSNQFPGGAVYKNGEVFIVINDEVQGQICIRAYNDNLEKNWEQEHDLNYTVRSFEMTSDDNFILGSVESSNIRIVKISNTGELIPATTGFKTFPGIVNTIKSTSDNGFLIIGATTSDYGSMMQLIKTSSDDFLLNN